MKNEEDTKDYNYYKFEGEELIYRIDVNAAFKRRLARDMLYVEWYNEHINDWEYCGMSVQILRDHINEGHAIIATEEDMFRVML